MLFSERFDQETRASRTALLQLVAGMADSGPVDRLIVSDGLSALRMAGRRLDNIGAARALADYVSAVDTSGHSALVPAFRPGMAERSDLLRQMLDAPLQHLAAGPSPAHAFGAFFAIEHVNLALAGSPPSPALGDFLDRVEAAIRQGDAMIAVAHTVLDMLKSCLPITSLSGMTHTIRSAPCAA